MKIGKPRKVITVEPDGTPSPDEVAEPVPANPGEEPHTHDASDRLIAARPTE
jgi:hypothetical protein